MKLKVEVEVEKVAVPTDRGKRFKEERYLSADVFVANRERIFYVKGKCKASIKRKIRSMKVGINSDIIFAKCSCPVGSVRLLLPYNSFII